MSFLSPWYLLGLLGIGIPLAIHLIRRQQAERVVLPTVRFLKRVFVGATDHWRSYPTSRAHRRYFL